MVRFALLAVVLPVGLVCVGIATAGLLTSCIEINDHFYHQVIDPDILEIGNDRYFVLAIVECEDVSRPNAFATCPAGCGLFPESAVKMVKGKERVCEGDYIFVYSDKCKIVKFKKESY